MRRPSWPARRVGFYALAALFALLALLPLTGWLLLRPLVGEEERRLRARERRLRANKLKPA